MYRYDPLQASWPSVPNDDTEDGADTRFTLFALSAVPAFVADAALPEHAAEVPALVAYPALVA